MKAAGAGRRKAACGFLMLAVCLVLSGCLLPSGTAYQGSTFDSPDPAGVVIRPGVVQVYTTASNSMFVPTYVLDLTNGQTSGLTNALEPPPWVRPVPGQGFANMWAPAVRHLGIQYVMYFSGSRSDGQMCLGNAVSYSPYNFVATNTELCEPTTGVNWIDPSLFQAPNGQVWLYYSRQWGPGGSEIDAQQLSPDGLTATGPATALLQYSDVAAATRPNNNGYYPTVENPQMVTDPANGFDLLVSVGTWGQLGAYHEVEVPCGSLNGACLPAQGFDTTALTVPHGGICNAAGASVVVDNDNNALLLFHGVVSNDNCQTPAPLAYCNPNSTNPCRLLYYEVANLPRPTASAAQRDPDTQQLPTASTRAPTAVPNGPVVIEPPRTSG